MLSNWGISLSSLSEYKDYHSNYPMPDGTTRYLGLMAERVTDTLYKSEEEWMSTEVSSEVAAYFGEMIPEKDGMIQRLRVDKLLSDAQRSWLLPENLSQ
ncbi:hypothetical protein CwatDRAFT_5305 [Crocosphaera watsonii WH 8501]|uniref:Uncharacterized protein n=2 Tax=Crocosphaera watsonii TaxID=263511 RepID=Q4C8X1_CROWT|nr:hypothetical protein CwatDRAFT_5305 [Crocosphaera watsonii WH 8501]